MSQHHTPVNDENNQQKNHHQSQTSTSSQSQRKLPLQQGNKTNTRRHPLPTPFFLAFYIFGIIICIPLSLLVWFARKNFFNETKVAGIGMIRHFVAGGHRVVWLTTWIDEYWANEDFHGVEIIQFGLDLHPGDWFTQNVALGYRLIASGLQPDLVVVDHSASCVPLLKWRFPTCKVLFYCHFPQQLVTPSRFFLYRWYSTLISLMEASLYDYADVIMVNSGYTAAQFRRVMPSVSPEKIRVVYPPCDVDSTSIPNGLPVSRKQRPQNGRYVFLSMNRFWPEKRLDIILDAAEKLKEWNLRPLIQLAGSVMPHIPESRIYYELLNQRCTELGIEDMIEFVPSPSEEVKFSLYRQCDSVIYTPPNEHFGIVPIEALEQRRPVIVINSGGPAETVIEGETGTKIAKTCGILLAQAMTAHMNRNVWEHLDFDDAYEVHKQRFQRDYSFNGFGGRIDDALSSLFPCYPSANRRLLQNLQKAAELPEIQHPPKIVRINEELQTIPPETPQNQAQDEVLPAVKANTNSILKNGYHHHNNHSSSNHHTTTTNGFKPKPKLPNGEMLIRQRSHA